MASSQAVSPPGQVGGLLAGSVASSDYRHILAAVEEAVAGGAGRNALALEFLLGFQTEIAGCCSCSDDDCIGLYPFLIVDLKPEGPLGEVGLGHDAETDVGSEPLGLGHDAETDVGSEPLGLGAEVVHHLLALDSLGIAGEILHFRGLGQLASGLDALVDHCLDIRAARIDGRSITGRTAADNQ